jgi:hypothetical protein
MSRSEHRKADRRTGREENRRWWSVANPIDLGVRLVDRLGDGCERRAQRIIHRLDGLLDPVSTEDVLEAGRQLWQECAATLGSVIDEVGYLLGLDAGGIAPVVGLAAASGVPYRIAWKLRLDLVLAENLVHAGQATYSDHGDGN